MKQTLEEIKNNDLINCLISRHELYARLGDPDILAGAGEYRAELMRRLDALKCCGNCVHYIQGKTDFYCKLDGEEKWANESCKGWTTDDLAKEERDGK